MDQIQIKDSRRKGKFTITENSFLDMEGMPPGEKLAYIILCRFADASASDNVKMKVKKLAAKVGVSEKTMQKHLSDLQAKGLIGIKPQWGSKNERLPNIYTIFSHDDPPAEFTDTPPAEFTDTPPQNLQGPPVEFAEQDLKDFKDLKTLKTTLLIPPIVPQEESGDKGKKPKKAKAEKKVYLDSVKLTDDEHAKLVDKYGEDLQWALERLNNYKMAKGVTYKSDYHALIGWVYNDWLEKGRSKGGGSHGSSVGHSFPRGFAQVGQSSGAPGSMESQVQSVTGRTGGWIGKGQRV